MTVRETAAHPAHPSALVLAVAGSATVATAFGMARYGYGLLLPDIQDDLMLTATMLGAIGTLAYVTYIVAAALVTRCIACAGHRVTVVAGGLFAVVGTIVVALAHGPGLLAVGVATAGASAGLVYPPFADAVDRLPAAVRARTLSTISCGTGWGVAVAAPIAIAAGDEWRTAFLAFAGCAAASTLYAARAFPGRRPYGRTGGKRRTPGFRRAAIPMLGGALLIGLGSAPFWTFAVDAAHHAGLDQVAGRALLGVAGVASVLGMGAAEVISRLGARWTFVLCALLEAAAIATVGLAAGHLVAVLAAAAAFGAAYNTVIPVTVLWGTRLYADQPSAGAAAAVGAQATGLLCGPLAGGIVADAIGLTATILGGAAVVLAAILFAPRGDITDRASPMGLREASSYGTRRSDR
ncbi:MAG: MFS transporter [Pseudonocardia sp.]|nr:MFS transporter [Pseudonocardia sp.]